MRTFNHARALLMLAAIAATASCSIKEDRRQCPCWLKIDISGCAAYTNEVTISAWNPEKVFSEKVSVADYPDGYETTLNKGTVGISAYCGLNKNAVKGHELIIPEGCQSDIVRIHSSLLECKGEMASDTVMLHRQYATIHISINQRMMIDPVQKMTVQGVINGIDILTLQPLSGSFIYAPVQNEGGVWSLRIPRQNPDSPLTLTISTGDDLVDEFQMDEWIRQSGYSWTDKDLKDIYIDVDYALGKVSIVIQGWEEGECIGITI